MVCRKRCCALRARLHDEIGSPIASAHRRSGGRTRTTYVEGVAPTRTLSHYRRDRDSVAQQIRETPAPNDGDQVILLHFAGTGIIRAPDVLSTHRVLSESLGTDTKARTVRRRLEDEWRDERRPP